MLSARNYAYLPKLICLVSTIPLILLANGCAWQQRAELETQAQTLQQKAEALAQQETAVAQRQQRLAAQQQRLDAENKILAEQKIQLEQERHKLEVLRKSLRPPAPAPTAPQTAAITFDEVAHIVVGQREPVFLEPPNLTFAARVDTGLQTSVLQVLDITEFERDGRPYVKFYFKHPDTGKKVEMIRRVSKRSSLKATEPQTQRRPVVKLRAILGNIDRRTFFMLLERANAEHQVLIGRNLLRDFAIVNVAEQFLTQPLLTPETSLAR